MPMHAITFQQERDLASATGGMAMYIDVEWFYLELIWGHRTPFPEGGHKWRLPSSRAALDEGGTECPALVGRGFRCQRRRGERPRSEWTLAHAVRVELAAYW